MAVQFEIIGRFFNVKDDTTNEVYISEVVDSLKYYRDDTDIFTFYPREIGTNSTSYLNLTKVGVNRNEFPFADIVDSVGAGFADADTLELWLASNLGYLIEATAAQLHSSLNLDDGTNPHGTTQTDVGLSDVDNTSDIDKPISTATQTALDLKLNDNYSEVFETFTNGTNNAWTINTLPAAYQDKHIFITCSSTNNNRTVGVRQVGSALTRSFRIDTDSSAAFMVYVNTLGQVEVFNSGNNVTWNIQMILPSL